MKKLITLIALLAIAGTASAALEVGDIAKYIYTANGDSDGTGDFLEGTETWNDVDAYEVGKTGNLVLVDGTDEGMTVSIVNGATGAGNNGGTAQSALPWAANLSAGNVVRYMYDKNDGSTHATYGLNDGLLEFDIGGLDDSLTYNISITGNGNVTPRYADETVTVNGATGVNSINYDSYASGNTTGAEMTWTGISSVGGKLTILADAADGARVTLGMVQIEVVPEPATVGMLGLGALVALLIRRIRA